MAAPPLIVASDTLCKYSSVNSPSGSFAIFQVCFQAPYLGVTVVFAPEPVILNLPLGVAQLNSLDFWRVPCTVEDCSPAFNVWFITPLIAEFTKKLLTPALLAANSACSNDSLYLDEYSSHACLYNSFKILLDSLLALKEETSFPVSLSFTRWALLYASSILLLYSDL